MTSGGNHFNDFAANQLIKFRWFQIQDKSKTPWNPWQDPEIKDCPGKSRMDGHLT